MKFSARTLALCVSAAFLLASTVESGAFALLGPVQPWMQMNNGVIFPGDIGGPMPIGSGYRWNVPVVTYGFGQSFLDFFGTSGVAAVESAIQILNDLPPASQIVLTNFPLASAQVNSSAQAQSLLDLKSQTLALLLPQLGLAAPTRYIYVLYDLNATFAAIVSSDTWFVGMPIFYEGNGWYSGPPPGGPDDITNFVAGFNFDPETLAPSPYVNGALFAAYINFGDGQFFTVPYSSNPLAAGDCSPVADYAVYTGGFYTGLTYDDVG